MKAFRKIGIGTSFVLAAALTVGMTACAGNVNSLYEDDYTYTAPTAAVKAIDALRDHTVDAIDAFGIVTAEKTEAIYEQQTVGETTYEIRTGTQTTYRLYDAVSDKEIASRTVVYDWYDTGTSAGYVSGYQKIVNGLYVLAETDRYGDTAYTFYGKAGELKRTEDAYSKVKAGVLFSDGTALVVDEAGAVRTVEVGLDAAFVPEWCTEFPDVYVQTFGSLTRIWDKEGKLLREVDIERVLKMPSDRATSIAWMAGNTYFVQYGVRLSDDASDYDLLYDIGSSSETVMAKIDLVTKSYDLRSGNVKEYDWQKMVYDAAASPYSDDGMFLWTYPIENKQLLSAYELQYYGENGSVKVDLQAMLEGANDFDFDGKYFVLMNDSTVNVYADGKCVGSVRDSDVGTLAFKQGYFTRTIGSTTYYYDLDGNALLETVSGSGALGDKVYEGMQNGVIYYSVRSSGSSSSSQSTHTDHYSYSQKAGETELGQGVIDLTNELFYTHNSRGEIDDVYLLGYDTLLLEGLGSDADNFGYIKVLGEEAEYRLYNYTESVETADGTATETNYVLVTIA